MTTLRISTPSEMCAETAVVLLSGKPAHTGAPVLDKTRSDKTTSASHVDSRPHGHRFDPEAALPLHGNRFHGATLGRLLEGDSAGYQDGMSLYEYVRGSPVSQLDWNGTQAGVPNPAVIEAKAQLAAALSYGRKILPVAAGNLEYWAMGQTRKSDERWIAADWLRQQRKIRLARERILGYFHNTPGKLSVLTASRWQQGRLGLLPGATVINWWQGLIPYGNPELTEHGAAASKGTPLEDSDLALGSGTSTLEGHGIFVADPTKRYSAIGYVRFIWFDTYHWTRGLKVDFGGHVVEDSDMLLLERSGIGREYELRGVWIEKVGIDLARGTCDSLQTIPGTVLGADGRAVLLANADKALAAAPTFAPLVLDGRPILWGPMDIHKKGNRKPAWWKLGDAPATQPTASTTRPSLPASHPASFAP